MSDIKYKDKATAKPYLVVGSQNAVTVNAIFKLILAKRMWFGTSHVKEFVLPDGSYQKFGNIQWFTNIDHGVELKIFKPTKKYKKGDYDFYDGYDVINVEKVKDIPCDYDGVMGVPISYLDFDCDYFDVVGIANQERWIGDYPCLTKINGVGTYQRLLIKKKC